MFLRYFVVTLCVFLLSACSSLKPFNSIPTKDEDFRVPPQEFIENFQDVERYRADNKNTPQGNYRELVEKWGNPDNIVVDKEAKYAHLGWSSSAFAVVVPEPAIWAGLTGLFVWLSPPPPEIHTWSKGNYRVRAYTTTSPAHKKARAVHAWEWEIKNNEQEAYAPLFKKKHKPLDLLFQLRFARGFGDFGDGHVNNPSGGTGLQLELGVEFNEVLTKTDLIFLYGTRKGVLVDDSDKNNQIEITTQPLQLIAAYHLDNRWRAGGGLVYLTNTRLDYNFKSDESLEDALGLVAQLDFTTVRQFRFGIAVESVTQDLPNGGDFNSSNLSAFSQLAFW